MIRHRTAILAATLCAGFAQGAQAQTLGTSVSAVRAAYAQAQAVTIDHARALELRDVDYGGFRWSRVDFVFDPSGLLQKMTMRSGHADYEAVLRAASAQLQMRPGLSAAAAESGPELQIRVCQDESGAVTVTYEAASVLS